MRREDGVRAERITHVEGKKFQNALFWLFQPSAGSPGMTQGCCTGPEDDLGIWFSFPVADRAQLGSPNKDGTQSP